MSDRLSKRSAVRGREQHIFNLVSKMATPQQWSTWLRDPLELALEAEDLSSVKRLLRAGADATGLEGRVSDLLLAYVDVKDKNGDSTIHFAAVLDHDNAMRLILEKGASKDSLDSEGCTPLHLAVEHGRVPAVEALLAADADVNLRCTGDGCTALDLAAINGHLDIMRLLLQNGADASAGDSRGYTSLHRAAFYNQADGLAVLAEAGADVNAPDAIGWTPLHDASAEGASDAVVWLLQHGAKEGKMDSRGRAPLHLAAERGNLPAAEALVAAGADVSPRYGGSECSALDFATIGGHLEVLKAIIQQGADVNSTASEGRTALHRAAFFNQAGAVDILIAAGAELEPRDSSFGWTPLLDASAEGSAEAVEALLRHGAHADALDAEGRAPLHLAAQAGRSRTVKALLAAGANSGLRRGDSNLFVLDVAVHEGRLDVVRELVAGGVDVDAADASGRTALHRAAFLDEDGAINILVRAGADLEARDGEGWTPLLAGAVEGSAEAVAALSLHGADQTAIDREGRAPLHLAAEYGHLEAAGALLDAGADINCRGVGDDEWSALDLAAVKGNLGFVRAMLLRGANVNACDAHGYTALHRAAFSNSAPAVDALVAAGADVGAADKAGWTPLHDASAEGSSEAVIALLRHGADQDALDREERSPLHLVVQRGCLATTECLLSVGADVSLRAGDSGCSALDLAVTEGHLDVLLAMIRRGADVNAADNAGTTALHRAAHCDRSGAVDVLLSAGASVGARDSDGRRPADVASARRSKGAAAALSRWGVGTAAKGRSPVAGRRLGPRSVIVRSATTEEGPDNSGPSNRFGGIAVGNTATPEVFAAAAAALTTTTAAAAAAGTTRRVRLDDHRDRDLDRTQSYAELLGDRMGQALAERAWQRRRWLVLFHAHPDKVEVRLTPDGSKSVPLAKPGAKPGAKLGAKQGTELGEELGREPGAAEVGARAGGSTVGGRRGSDCGSCSGRSGGGGGGGSVSGGGGGGRGGGSGALSERPELHRGDACTAGDLGGFIGLAVWLLRVEETGLFRKIVGFL